MRAVLMRGITHAVGFSDYADIAIRSRYGASASDMEVDCMACLVTKACLADTGTP